MLKMIMIIIMDIMRNKMKKFPLNFSLFVTSVRAMLIQALEL